MSTFAVTAEKIEVLPHPNADKLELAKIGEYRAVIPKGKYLTGQTVFYIPEQALLPGSLIKHMGLEGKLAGSKQNRVKAVKLRGELSQGLVLSIADATEYVAEILEIDDGQAYTGLARDIDEQRDDFSELFGIKKWRPEIPVQMAGNVDHVPVLVPWLDIENIKRYPDIFTPGEQVIATEKIHGTCCCATYDVATDKFYVSSKGLGRKQLALRESDENVYWRMIKRYKVEQACRALARLAEGKSVARIAIFGEVYGKGVQDLQYGNKLDYAVFDAQFVYTDGTSDWIYQEVLPDLFDGETVTDMPQIPTVPILYVGAYDYDGLAAMAEGPETVSGFQSHMREGLVVRAAPDRFDDKGGRAIAKFVSEAYLTRKGGTEYE